MKSILRVCAGLFVLAAMTCAASAAVRSIDTVSSRPDRVSGGDVLVRIDQDNDAATSVTLNGRDVSRVFAPGAGHTRMGLVTGLRLGANTLAAGGVTLKLTDYPIAGPITSGPHQSPFICTTATFQIYATMAKTPPPSAEVFGPPTDANCSAPTKITYLYLPKGAAALVPLPSPTALPADVATTATSTGRTVNFIVRVETATIDRGIYQSAVLFDPTKDSPPSWRTPPPGWNRRLIAIQGAGCPGGWYFQGVVGGSMSRPGMMDANLLSVQRLGEGYATYGNTLQNASQDCNSVLEGEAAMMGKEHFIKSFGAPDFTVSVGCSGGSYGSAQPADALPGLYDGILIACTFPDPLAIANSGADAHLLTHFFDVTAKGAFTEAQALAISGYKTPKAFLDAANQVERTDPVPHRDDAPGYKSAVWNPVVPAALRYDPTTNPHGARPTIYDAGRNVYGVDARTGFGLRTFDNVGVQYGLAAVRAGAITPDQFLDLNARIGGLDQDANYVAPRSIGDAGALSRAYQSGLELSGGGGLASIPVFDISGIYNDDGGYHYQWFHFALRERMAHANGDAGNHVMWRGNPAAWDKAWATFIAWVEAVHADASAATPRQKAIQDRPAAAVDGCWRSATDFVAEPQSFSREPTTTCNALFPSFANPRFEAGGPLAADVLKCQLRPIEARAYPGFSADQLARLSQIFPGGVCDWAKPGVGQTAVVPWASFGPAPENLVFSVTSVNPAPPH
ncbi:MAG TPA: DUF6351 family protein [Caulobacteraceae bacterium]|jgi:hypothetical protein|nr:DUF6351 family protein [Caulobacteraceae bacterium]